MQPVTATCFPLFLDQSSTHCRNNCVYVTASPELPALPPSKPHWGGWEAPAWSQIEKLGSWWPNSALNWAQSPEALRAASSVGGRAKGRSNTRLRYNSKIDSCTRTRARFCYGRLKWRKISKKYSTFPILWQEKEVAGPASVPSTKTF